VHCRCGSGCGCFVVVVVAVVVVGGAWGSGILPVVEVWCVQGWLLRKVNMFHNYECKEMLVRWCEAFSRALLVHCRCGGARFQSLSMVMFDMFYNV
jgi:hypothetical protein